MNLTEHFHQLRKYDAWANQEVLKGLQGAAEPPARCVQWLAHIVAAEALWMARLKVQSPPLPVWPELSLNQCEEHVQLSADGWAEYFAEKVPDGLEETVSYKNSKGEPWNSTVGDILTHVFFHSAYHRGQIASEMRRTGHTPAYTDFIHGVRQGLLD